MAELLGGGRPDATGRHRDGARHIDGIRPFDTPPEPIIVRAGSGPKPVAYVPTAEAGTRTLITSATVVIATDFSPSVGWTDADNARLHDLRDSLVWGTSNMGDEDRFVLVSFTAEVAASGLLSANEALRAVEQGRPIPPSSGGTAFLPVAKAALNLIDDVESAHLALVTDGMSHDVAAFAEAVADANLRTTLIPFGSDWPFVKASWSHADHIRLAAHVSDQPLAIARALAHVMLDLTGQTPKPPRRKGLRAPRKSSKTNVRGARA